MQFLSRFSSSKAKDPSASSSSSKAHRRHSTPPPSAQSTSYLPLDLPSSSFLRDDSLSVPFGISPKPSRSRQIGHEEEGLAASGSSRSVDTQPWVEIQGQGDGSPRMRQQSEEEMRRGKKEDLMRVRKECARLEKARIGQEQMITLMDECGETIRSRGLTTLGIFRPYRSSESLPQIRKLSLLFLDYASEFSSTTNAPSSSTRGTEASKTVKLHRFKEELRFAEIHDLVSVLKWGLRHFTPSSPFPLGSSTSPSEFYRSFLSSISRASYPHSSFSAYLLPSLPPPSQRLLISTLATIQAVSAYSEQNAMTSRRLCRLIGYYLFAPPSQHLKENWEGLYESWRESGMVLEGCLKAFLWEQDDLPPRLQELVSDFGRFVERSRTGDPDSGVGGRRVRVLKVEVESRGEGWRRIGEDEEGVNDQETGYLVGGQREGRYARRKPIEIMLDAFEAGLEGNQGAEGDTWRVVRDKGKGDGWREVLDDETVRVFDLLGLSTTTSSASPAAPSPRRHQSDASPFRLSALEESPPSGSPSFANFPNRSVTHLSPQDQQKRVVTPSWNDFTQKGFSSTTPNNLSDEFGQFRNGSSSSGERSIARSLPKRGESKIVKIEWMEIDEEFSDVWLDTLIESTTTSSPVSSWPSILVAPFRPSLLSSLPLESSAQQHLHLFIYEKLLPLVDAPPPTPAPFLQRNQSSTSRKGRNDPSETSSLNPRSWTKRASSIFGSKREPSTENTATIGSLAGTKSKKQSRKSMVIPDLPPPIPIVSNQPRRSSMDPSSTSPQPYSTSPSDGNVITRTISRTMARRKSRSSISSPTEEKDRQLPYSSPPKFEAELMGAPVPAIPAKYSMEAEEAKRRSQASPVTSTKPLEEDDLVEEKPVKESAVPLMPQSISPPLPETPLKEVLLQGQPILGAVNASLLNPSPSTENAIPLADSPTISRAAAIRTPSSEAGSLLLNPVASPVSNVSSSHGDDSEIIATPAPMEPRSMETVASPTFTLSPPGGEAETLPAAVDEEIREPELVQEEGEVIPTEKSESVSEATNLGLGLSNIEEPPFQQPEIVPSSGPVPNSPPQPESTTPASPALLATPTSTKNHSSAEAEANTDSPTIPVSPTPSATSQGSTSKKFLARTRSFLTRKKSSNKLEQEREKASKAEAKKEMDLRRTQEDESRKPATKERKVPTPVSSVKKRVAELNQIANTNGSPNSITPSPSTNRFGKASSPTPASPTPLPSSNLPQPGSAASSIVPLPAVDEPQQIPIKEEEGKNTSVLQPEHAAPEVVKQIEEEELATEFGSISTEETPFARPSNEILESQPESTIPSVVVDEPPAQEAEHLGVKVPSALEDLPSPLPSPTPQSNLAHETPVLVSKDETPAQSSLSGFPTEGTINTNETRQDAPAQEASHLAVKLPSQLEDLPSPIPSPSPLPDDQTPFDPLTSEPEAEQTLESTETIFPIPPTFVSPTQDISDLHHRDPSSSATVVPDQDEMESNINHSHLLNGDAPRTPSKQNEGPHDLSTLVTPTAPPPPIFHSSSSSPHNNSEDPFIDSTPVKPSSSSNPPPPLVSSQSNFSISTRNSTDTFETAAAPSTATSANASAASSIHNHEE